MIRVRTGDVTAEVTGDMETWLRRAVDQVAAGVADEMERQVAPVAEHARATWYTRVRRRTGKSGDIRSAVVIDLAKEEIRASVYSTDTRSYRGKPVPVLVHPPGPLSTITRPATYEDFRAGRAKHSGRGARIKGYGVVTEPNPLASDGRTIWPELVQRPTLALRRSLVRAIRDKLPKILG